jgi:hypothetical protein
MQCDSLSSLARDTNRPNWFEQRRKHCIRQLVDDFFILVDSFQQLYGVYLDCRSSSHDHDQIAFLSPDTKAARGQIWNRLSQMIGTETEKGQLWKLKDLCHQLWPEQEQEYDVHGSLIDWLLGSVFHEAMKLKENIYLLNTYGPAAVRIHERPSPPSMGVLLPAAGPFPQLSSMVDVEGLVHRIADDVVNQMDQIGFLLGQANFILRMMMPDLATNMLVVRLLVEEEKRVQALWGESIEELFTDMFFGNGAQGFCAAGQSYWSGQWYPRALMMYERALEMDATCDEALARIAHLKAMLNENSQLKNWGAVKQEGKSAQE